MITALIPLNTAADKSSNYAVKSFKDWMVACNNQHVCSASSFLALTADEPNVAEVMTPVAFSLERAASANSLVKLSLEASNERAWNEKLIGHDISLKLGKSSFELGKLSKQQVDSFKIELPAEHLSQLLK